jgi:ABC-type phosphate/phosphonate transport system substrate-binding protein
MRLANLPWYDFKFLSDDYRLLWSALREILSDEGVGHLPPSLNPSHDLDSVLADPRLLVSQTCGYDIAVGQPVPLTIILTPSYSAPGCGDGTYSSWIVVREDSPIESLTALCDARLIANDDRSWSGYHCLRGFFGNFSEIRFSGGHGESLRRLQAGQADIAAIDCIVWALLRRYEPSALDGLRVIGRTPEVPAPPLVTRAPALPHELRALRKSFCRLLHDDSSRRLCERLLLKDFLVSHPSAYSFMSEGENVQTCANE